MNKPMFQVAIIGGGLAGLTLAIQLRQKNISVVLVEKEQYPFHRVCGEYISMESWPFLERLGIPLSEMNLPRITQLKVSSPNGNILEHQLNPGGFGISRYTLDHLLYQLALHSGVVIHTACKVNEVIQHATSFHLSTTAGQITAELVCGSWGKRSNLDVKFNRDFITPHHRKLNGYIGIKYHIETDLPHNTISLHNFKNGYCGVSRIENNRYCLCYLTTADNLRKYDGDIKAMEQQLLSENRHLQSLFTDADFIYDKPLVISQISFEPKTQVEQNILMLGDAAGLITPLCGNGMSMAMHASFILSGFIESYLNGLISLSELSLMYRKAWYKQFHQRLKAGRMIQGLFGNKQLTNWVVSGLKPFPFVVNKLIASTHGQPF